MTLLLPELRMVVVARVVVVVVLVVGVVVPCELHATENTPTATATTPATPDGSLRKTSCQPAELTGSIGNRRSAAGASAGTTGCSGAIGASRLYGSPCAGR